MEVTSSSADVGSGVGELVAVKVAVNPWVGVKVTVKVLVGEEVAKANTGS